MYHSHLYYYYTIMCVHILYFFVCIMFLVLVYCYLILFCDMISIISPTMVILSSGFPFSLPLFFSSSSMCFHSLNDTVRKPLLENTNRNPKIPVRGVPAFFCSCSQSDNIVWDVSSASHLLVAIIPLVKPSAHLDSSPFTLALA